MAKVENVSLRKLPGELTINLTVSKELRARLWIAKKLLILACWVLGCGLNLNVGEDQ
ncbi:MAG: hypothetical protein M0Z43_06690 [Acidithiobacillus sp.]|nr:hypothetical protein [Acidithiobacillus sp.]